MTFTTKDSLFFTCAVTRVWDGKDIYGVDKIKPCYFSILSNCLHHRLASINDMVPSSTDRFKTLEFGRFDEIVVSQE